MGTVVIGCCGCWTVVILFFPSVMLCDFEKIQTTRSTYPDLVKTDRFIDFRKSSHPSPPTLLVETHGGILEKSRLVLMVRGRKRGFAERCDYTVMVSQRCNVIRVLCFLDQTASPV